MKIADKRDLSFKNIYLQTNGRSGLLSSATQFFLTGGSSDTDHFLSNVAKGAMIDYDTEPDLQKTAIKSVKNFCSQTRINLAGFDILFSSRTKVKIPIFLEINYFFGRKGLGGSEKFYDILTKEIMKWIESLGLSLNK